MGGDLRIGVEAKVGKRCLTDGLDAILLDF